jgi:glycosyltransferase involved in cell wall biosynthesis
MKRLNILFCNHQSFPDWIGGAELVLLNTAKYIDRIRFTPFFLSSQSGMVWQEVIQSGLQGEIIEHDMFWDLLNPNKGMERSLKEFQLYQNSKLNQIKNYIKKQEIDVVASNCIVNILPLVAAKALGIPTLWLIHEIVYAFDRMEGGVKNIISKWLWGRERYQKENNLRLIGQTILKYSNITVFNSETSRSKIFALTSYDETILAIHPPIRREIFNAPSPRKISFNEIPDDAFVIAFLGILVRHKGVHHFIEAASRVLKRKQNIYFIIAGGAPDPSYYHYLQNLVRKKKGQGKIFFKGFLKNPLDVYDRADVVCMTSLYEEPFGMVVTEAMLRGKTVLAYDTGSVREIITQGVTGYILPYGGIQALADQIMFLEENRTLAKNIGENSRKYAMDQYNPMVYQERIEDILGQLVER